MMMMTMYSDGLRVSRRS